MNAGLRYELRARAFELMTGQLAPGKDAPAEVNGASMEEREQAWREWLEQHFACVEAMLKAVDELVEGA